MTAIEYTIYEQPQPPELDSPISENPTSAKPSLDFPTTAKPTTENPTQLNKDISRTDLSKKDQSITDLSSTDSIPILSPDPSPCGDAAAVPPERKRKEAATQSAVEIYREIIMENRNKEVRRPRPSIRAQLATDKKTAAPKKAAARSKKHEMEV